MKWIILSLLWLLAVALALFVLWRTWRGRNAVLRGRWSPRLVRMVAVVLVLLGAGQEKARSAPAPTGPKAGRSEDELPPVVTADTVTRWLAWQQPGSAWWQMKQHYVRLSLTPRDAEAARRMIRGLLRSFPARFKALVEADLDAGAKAASRPDAKVLIAALDDMERAGLFDQWACAYLWRKAAGGIDKTQRTQAVELFARLNRHARMTNALVRAQARVKPFLVPPRAWMSKAGPKTSYVVAQKQAVGETLKTARWLYAGSDTGTWERDGCVLASVARGSAPLTLVRAGHRQELKEGATVRLNRLDLVETPAGGKPVVLEHAWLGQITLPADRTLSVWDLPALLPAGARHQAEVAVGEALDGEEKPARKLEQALPLVQRVLREKLVKTSNAKGAPRLRLILSLFDDAVMPALAPGGVPTGPALIHRP